MVVSRLNTAKNNTINPAVLKNTPEFFDCENLTEVKDISDSTGSVPREKTSIIKAPESQFPVVMAANCIDWVKPQGRKKVNIPKNKGKPFPLIASVLSAFLVNAFGIRN